MASDVQIREDPAGLHFRVRKGPELWVIAVEIVITAFVVYLLLRYASGVHPVVLLIMAGLSVVHVVRDAVGRARGTDVELDVADGGLVSAGHAPGGYAPCSIARVDVSNMLFREAMNGEGPELPRGLYVERYDASAWSMGGDCVLPGIDAEEAERVIKEILRRFPDTEYVGPGQMSKGGLTLLNLHETKRE